jgi:hypothetical protein
MLKENSKSGLDHAIIEQPGYGDCFITTACTVAMGLPDDCAELVTLRKFRDEYVRQLPNGGKIIDEYYRIAPAIVRKINERPDHEEVFAALFRQIEKAVQLICERRDADAFVHYVEVIKRLKKEYMNWQRIMICRSKSK